MDAPAPTPDWLTGHSDDFPDSAALELRVDDGEIRAGSRTLKIDAPISVQMERYEEGAWWRRLLGLERPCLRATLRQDGSETTLSAVAQDKYVAGLPWRLEPRDPPASDVLVTVSVIEQLLAWLNSHGRLTVARWPQSSTVHPRDRTRKVEEEEEPTFWAARSVAAFIWMIIAIAIVITPLVGFTLLVCDDLGVDALLIGGAISGLMGGVMVRWQARKREWWPDRALEQRVTTLKAELAGWASPLLGAGAGVFYGAGWSDYFRPNQELSYLELCAPLFVILGLVALVLHMRRRGVLG